MSLKKLLLFCSAFSFILTASFPSVATRQPIQRASTREVQRIVPRRSRLTQYEVVQRFLKDKNYEGLRKEVSRGLNLNATNYKGDSAICTALKRSDVEAFSMLQALGADLSPSCMKEISLEDRQAFINEYQAEGGFLPFYAQEDMLAPPINWKLWGGVGAGVVGVGTVAAIASGGGGGSSSGEPNQPPVASPQPPDVDDDWEQKAQTYVTPEFSGRNFSGYTNVTNFLSQINTHYAYARAEVNGKPVAGEGITVGVIDSGVDINHQDLKNNIKKDEFGNALGANFNYGPCKGTDTTNCWVVGYGDQAQTQLVTIFYDENGNMKTGYYIKDDMLSAWSNYWDAFPEDWDWDEHKNDPSPDDNPDNAHGTHVAGIIAAEKNGLGMHGVAYNADIVGVNLGVDWVTLDEDYLNAFKYVTDKGAKVINNSWGYQNELDPVYLVDDISKNKSNWDKIRRALTPAIEYASITNDAITLFAAGNDGNNEPLNERPQPSIEAAAPMVMPSLLYYNDSGTLKPFNAYPTDESQIVGSRFVSVVSLNSSNQLAFYSQKCGASARWCISAPGGEQTSLTNGGIISTVPNYEYGMMQGTSMATPVVSGALATILGASPSLKTEEAVAIMFETATDLGTNGVDDVYGWGLVNLQRALQPVGTTTLALGNTTTGAQMNFIGSRLTMPKIFPASILSKLPKNIVVLDKYKRAFNVPLKSVFRSTTHSKQSFADSLRSFTRYKKVQKFKASENFSMSFSENSNAFNLDNLNGLNFDMTYQSSDKLTFSFAFNENAKDGMECYFDQSLRNPFTTSATDLYSLSNSFKVRDNFNIGLAFSFGKNNFFDGNDKLDYQHEDNLQIGSINLSYSPFKSIDFDFSAGVLNEENSVLGLNGKGAFNMDDSKTYFMGTEMIIKPMNGLSVSASYYYGNSKSDNFSSLMRLSDIQSESIAMKASYQVNKTDIFGVRANSPLYIRKATAMFDLPVARDAKENIIYRKQIKADLRSETREWDFSLFAVRQTDNWQLQCESMIRLNPEHQGNVKNDYRLMFSFGFNY